ncbi:hypothetical protein LI177_08590 [bacterium 210820-DFI.6.37]|nr:hypothetical protein [bacterium 210820-DFI.6.37]
MYIASIVCFSLTVLLQGLFCESLLQVKYRYSLPICFVLLALLFPIFEHFGLMEMFRPSLNRTVINIILMLFCILFFCRDALITRLFTFFLSLLLLIFPEIIISIPCVFFLARLTGSTSDAFISTPIMIPVQILYLLFEMLSMLLVSNFIRKRRGKLHTPDLSQFILFLIVQLVLFMGFIYFTVCQFDDITSVTTSSIMFCVQIGLLSVLADLAIYFILLRLQEKERIRCQSEFYQRQLELQLLHLRDFSLYNETLSQIRHDLRGQLSTVQALISRKEYDTAASLTGALRQTLDDLSIISCCENPLVNALIFNKYKSMQKQGIPFTCDADLDDSLSISGPLLCETLSDLLDQAVKEYHNNKQLPIHLKLWQENDLLKINIKGPIQRSVHLALQQET